MVIRKPYPAGLRYWYRNKVWQAASLALVGLLIVATPPQRLTVASASLTPLPSGNAPSVSAALDSSIALISAVQSASTRLNGNIATSIPDILSPQDQMHYTAIFQAQKSADWEAADAQLAAVKNDVLLGHVLAQRYQSHHYTPTKQQLREWLSHYNDLPQASAIAALSGSSFDGYRKQVLAGYGDDHGVAMQEEDNVDFYRALSAWRHHDKTEAARRFSALADQQNDISSWNASASAYWAYRTNKAIGSKAEATHYLHIAAMSPRSFYGILARKQLNQSLELDSQPQALADSDILELVGNPAIKRIIALAQAGMPELAEQEMRVVFPQSDGQDKFRLLALAHHLHLASVQIAMANQLSTPNHELDFARYPTPSWQPARGFTVDPALIYALARQESGFRAAAVSSGGALGLMQLMPGTALLMQKHLNHGKGAQPFIGNVAEPVLNMTLGEHYVQHLLDNDMIDDNLIYLLAAYNAGPGKLQAWKEEFGSKDPLLFIENIPCAQTRHYVMQVMANYWIYSELEGKANPSVISLMNGDWPTYNNQSGVLAEAKSASLP